MAPTQADHFLFNSSLFAPKLRMMIRGIRVDQDVVDEKKAEAAAGVWRLQALIDEVAVQNENLARLQFFLDGEPSESGFAQLVLSCLGGSNPRVRCDVTVERWQPMRWEVPRKKDGSQRGAGVWKKAGKLLDERPIETRAFESVTGWLTAVRESDSLLTELGLYYKPAHKTVFRLQSFVPSTLADCEDHVLESKEDEWRRVKQIWKELCHANNSKTNPGGAGGKTALLGELSTLLGLAVNVGSNSEGGDSQWFLYEACGLPRMYCDARTGRYSRESEAEWKKRTKEKMAQSVAEGAGKGVRNERRRNRSPRQHCEASDAGCDADRPAVGQARCNDAGVDGDKSQADAESLGAGGQVGAGGSVDGMSASESTTASLFGTAKGTKRLSTDQIALDRLYAQTQDVRVLWVLQQRRLRKVVCDLSTRLDKDGRLRASISLVKETGRMSESAAPTGCGLNRQALNKDLLAICIPDEGYEMAKLDLEGADSWTVACEAASLGDSTMLDDLKAGIKPAQVVGLIYVHNASFINSLAREEITRRLPEIKQRAWLYPASKAIAHGTPYGMGWETLQMTLLKNSMSELPLDLKDSRPIVLSKQQIEDLREAFFSRYPGVKKWQEKVGRQLMEKGWLATSTGHVRRFYGRKSEISKGRKVVNHETWKEALASMPQYYTTYSIKQAWGKMWRDPENWRYRQKAYCIGYSEGDHRSDVGENTGERVQIVEPLALKHDEILMQWRKEDREWAIDKLREWFRTPVTIAGIEVVIPAAGKIGSNWRMEDGEPLKL